MDAKEKLTTDVVYQIWNDKTGYRVEIGPDRDAGELTEIRSYSDDGTLSQSVTLTRSEAIMANKALEKHLRDTE